MGGSLGDAFGSLLSTAVLACLLASLGALWATMRWICQVEEGLLWRVPGALALAAAVLPLLALLEHSHLRFVRRHFPELCAALAFSALWLSVKLFIRTSWLRALVSAGASVGLALTAAVVSFAAQMR